jgi:hypothetical protein
MSYKLDEKGFVIQDGSMGYFWRRNVIRRNGKKSQTTGKMKAENCQATPIARHMAKRSRSYKHRGYSNWCVKHDGTKKGTRA